MSKGLADLSYRGYSGDHAALKWRWWVIAKMSIRTAFKKKSFWVFSSIAGWYYFILIAFLYVIEQVGLARGAGGIAQQLTQRLVWKDQFLLGLGYSQIIWLSLALLIGIGSIANDNGTNALLVYLSKPARKIDYLVGKWMGVFIPMVVAMGLSTAIFYLYGVLNFRAYGFVSGDPWLGLRLLAIITGISAFYSSLLIGVSSLFKKGQMAGAAFSAGYFLFAFFSFLMFVAWAVSQRSNGHRVNSSIGGMAEKLYYCSVDGLQTGLTKIILNTKGSAPFGAQGNMPSMEVPPSGLIFGTIFVLSAIGVLLAWTRIKAVEVVR